MTGAKSPGLVTGVRLLSLLLAALLWLGVTLERTGEVKLRVPVVLGDPPTGLRLASAPPGNLEVTVSGPRILLLGLPLRRVSCRLDLTGAGAGPNSFGAPDCNLGLDRELKLVRVQPATMRLTLANTSPR